MKATVEWFANRQSRAEGNNYAGLEYDEELSGPDGVHVTLFVLPDTTRAEIAEAKRAARYHSDVTGFSVAVIDPAWLEAERFTASAESPGWIDAARWIVEHHQARRIDESTGALVPESKRGGMLLDTFSASAMVAVYDALSPENQPKFGAMPLRGAHALTFDLIQK